MTGLYIHIPFCAKKCHYCDFVIAAGAPEDERGAFLDALEREISRAAETAAAAIFETVYLGGGTPSLLGPAELERLFGMLRSHFRWAPGAEITVEANPGDVDAKKAALLKKLGANRVSLGAQSFHDRTLERLNRTHRAADIDESFARLREAGFDNVNLDLILSLPGESWDEARRSLERLARLGPEHVSLYELTVEEKTVFGDMRKKGTLRLPGEHEQLETLSNARAFLKSSGYGHYELLNYAKPGRESRHNLLYWANEDTLGLGPGAFTHWNGRRYRFAQSYRQYLDKIAAGDWEPAEQETLAPERKQVESFLLALRLTDGAPLERFAPVADRFESEIGGLAEKGLLSRGGGRIRLTERGQFLAETVFAELSC